MPSRTPKRALASVFAAVTLVTSVFAVPGVCAEPPADVVVGFVDRPEPGYYSRTVMPTLAAMARAMPDRTVTGVRLSPDDPIADLVRLRLWRACDRDAQDALGRESERLGGRRRRREGGQQ